MRGVQILLLVGIAVFLSAFDDRNVLQAQGLIRALPLDNMTTKNVISDSESTENCRVPRSEPAVRGKTSYSARTNRFLAEASDHSYYANDFLFDPSKKHCLNELVATNRKKFPQKTALYFVEGFVSSTCQEQIQYYAPSGYHLKAVFCEADGHNTSKQFLGSGDKCGLFMTFYEHKNTGVRMLAIKGSSSTQDWKNNVLNRGAKYVEDAARNFFKNSDVEKAEESGGVRETNDPGKYLRYFVSNNSSDAPISTKSSATLLMTGHSLGGALAHNLAAGIKLKWPESRNIHLVTFNTLSAEAQGQSLAKRIFKKSDEFFAEVHTLLAGLADLPRKQASTAMEIPPGITGLSLTTFDDVLQPLNTSVLRSPLHVMPFDVHVLLSNRMSMSGESRLKSVQGHRMQNVLRDLCWTQHESFQNSFKQRWAEFDPEATILESRKDYYLNRNSSDLFEENRSSIGAPDTLVQGMKEERLRQLPRLAKELGMHYGPKGRSTLAVGYRCMDRQWDCSKIKDRD